MELFCRGTVCAAARAAAVFGAFEFALFCATAALAARAIAANGGGFGLAMPTFGRRGAGKPPAPVEKDVAPPALRPFEAVEAEVRAAYEARPLHVTYVGGCPLDQEAALVAP